MLSRSLVLHNHRSINTGSLAPPSFPLKACLAQPQSLVTKPLCTVITNLIQEEQYIYDFPYRFSQ